MKRLTLLLALMMATALGEWIVLSNRVAAAAAPLVRPASPRPVDDHGIDHQITARDQKKPSNDKTLLPAGPTSELEMKRLKLMFLLMMSLQEGTRRQ